MTEQQSTSQTDTPPVQSEGSAPLPGEGKGGCLGLLMGVGVMLVLSVAVTVVGYFVVHTLGWV